MNLILLLGSLVACLGHVAGGPVDHVNMYIGTSFWRDVNDNHDLGNTMLNIGLPFAHTPWTAQTRQNEDKCRSPYYYFDKHWQGMRRSHWMSGSCVIDYGSATVLPALTLNLADALTFHTLNHASEDISPHLYRTSLPESGLQISATSKNAAGVLRVTPTSNDTHFFLLFMASDTMYNQSSVSIPEGGADDVVIVSSPVHRWYQSKGQPAGFSGHHHFRVSRAPDEVGIINGYGEATVGARDGTSSAHGPAVAYMKFSTAEGGVTVATGCSFISPEKAHFNMKAELADNGNDCEALFDLDQHAAEVKEAWERELGRVEVTPPVPDATRPHQKEEFRNNTMIFYTALWHSLLLPRVVSDADGAYLSFTDTPRSVQYTHTAPADSLTEGPLPGATEGASLQFGAYYDDYSMWDIFRAQVPLLNLLLPAETVRDMVASLTVKARQGHWMPIFPAWNSYTGEMVGDHCGVWIADAVLKGIVAPDDPAITGLATQTAGAAEDKAQSAGALYYVLKNALMVPRSEYAYTQSRGRRALNSTLQYGYIPLEDAILASPHPRQQVSRTLEYAYDDHVLLQLLRHLATSAPGVLQSVDWQHLLQSEHNQVSLLQGVTASTSSAEIIDRVAHHLTTSRDYYRNVLDSGAGFVRGRHANGSWAEPDSAFDPAVYYPWLTETNVWQYTWFVPHDVEGMIALLGGDEAYLAKLNTFFDEGWYNHGNEPDHHAPYLAAYAHIGAGVGGAWQVQERVHRIIRSQYLANERGLPGNEDAGQMSAWLVMSTLGMYQVCPGCGGSGSGSGGGGEYVLTTPLFDDLTLRLPSRSSNGVNTGTPGSATLRIVVSGRSDPARDIYIQRLLVNGAPHDCAFVSHAQVLEGGLWEFFVGAKPEPSWGSEGRSCLI